MRPKWILLFLAILLTTQTPAQTISPPPSAASDPQAVMLAQQANLVLTAGNTVNDIVLTGTATSFLAASPETARAVLKARGTGESRIDLSFGSSQRTDIRNDSAPDGRWIGADGASHHYSLHNCWTLAPWFSAESLVAGMLGGDAVLSYVGQETRNGVLVDHIKMFRRVSRADPSTAALIRKLTATDIFLASTSHLPISVTFMQHPDNDAGTDVPVEIRFADYRQVAGVRVPFRIQKLVQGGLELDLTVTTVSINSGISESNFAIQ